MTLAMAPLPQTILASPEVRRSLTAMLRRRLPAQDVDDVAQTVLCDAMAAERIPGDPEELRRWLAGIARHKVVDFHRRSGRLRPTEHVDGVSGAPNHEDREVLARLLAEPRTRRDAQTFEWLVREHDGDRLQDIAAEEDLPAPVVRQRVSRLRRALRSRWATAMLLALVVGGGFARRSFTETTIAAEPASSVPESRPPTLIESLEGDWVLDGLRLSRPLGTKEQRLVDLSRDAIVRIHDGNVRLKGGAFDRGWNVASVDGMRVVLVDGGTRESIDIVPRGDRLEVRARGATITLKRATY